MVYYYKSHRWINRKLTTVITDEYDNIVRNPTKEQIKMAVLDNKLNEKKLNMEGRTCCRCKSHKTYIKLNDRPEWHICGCGKIDCTGYLCNDCYVRYDSNSFRNIIKSITDSRIGNLDPFSPKGRGFIGAQIIAKTNGVDDCNIKMDNFNFSVDLSKHIEYGYSEVKTSSLNIIDGQWSFNGINPENFDTLFLVCMDEYWPWKNVERIYIIRDKYVDSIGITIMKNPSRSTYRSKERFRIDPKAYNDTYHNMKLENCKVLRK